MEYIFKNQIAQSDISYSGLQSKIAMGRCLKFEFKLSLSICTIYK